MSATENGTATTFSYSNTYPDRLTTYGLSNISYNSSGYPTVYGSKHFDWSKGKLVKYYDEEDPTGSISSESTEFTYNGFGQRTSKEYTYNPGADYSGDFTTGKETKYEYDHSGRLIREITTEYFTESATQTREFIFLYDESGMIGFMYSFNNATPQAYYYRKNLLGDVIAIYNTSGAKVVEYAYDAWGNCTIKGTTTNYVIAYANPIRYRGYYFDEDTNLYYLNARYYSPEFRRFISPDGTNYLDPKSVNGLNLYCYCGNDPINFVDPSGHFVITLSAVLWAAAIGFGVGAVSGAVYGGITAAANGQDVWAGIGIGALTGGIMGAGAGVASLFIAPILAGGGVAIGATSISAGASLAIGTGISFGTGAIGGAVSDIWTQHVNNGAITDIDSIINSAFQWGFINTFGAFIGSVGGPLTNLETALITGIFNNVTGSVGLTIDAIRGNSTRRKPILA